MNFVFSARAIAIYCNKHCNFVTKVLNLIYTKLQKQKAKLIKSGLVIEEFGRLNNYAIESLKVCDG